MVVDSPPFAEDAGVAATTPAAMKSAKPFLAESWDDIAGGPNGEVRFTRRVAGTDIESVVHVWEDGRVERMVFFGDRLVWRNVMKDRDGKDE